MTRLDAVRPLFAHMEWADAMVWRAVRDCAAASDDPGKRGRGGGRYMGSRNV